MIKELKMINWKSFKESTLYIDPLTVLIGNNASGKSNTLDALLFLNRVSLGVSIFSAIAGDTHLLSLRGGMEWVCRKPEAMFGLVIIVDGENDSTEYRYELTVQVNKKKAEVFREGLTLLSYGPRSAQPKERMLFQTKQEEADSPGIPTYYSTGTQGRGKRFDLNRSQPVLVQTETTHNSRKEVQEGAKYVLVHLQRIFVFDPIPSHMRDFKPLSEKMLADGSNVAGVIAGLDTDRRHSVEKTLTRYLRGLPEREIRRVWTELEGKFKTDAMLYCEESWANEQTHEMDARGMSDGTLRYLAIVAALLISEPRSLLVIEEVDNGLHPSRARILLEMIKTLGKEREIDVIVTTHNPALLDAAGASMVPFITVTHRSIKSGYSQLTQLEDISNLPKLMSGGGLGRLSADGHIESALKEDDLI